MIYLILKKNSSMRDMSDMLVAYLVDYRRIANDNFHLTVYLIILGNGSTNWTMMSS